MPRHHEILAGLEESFSQAVRLSGAVSAPAVFLTVVDLYGELLADDPRFRTMSEARSRDFSIRFREWLGDKSKELQHASLSEAAESLNAPSEFSGRFLVFKSLSDFATWYAQPAHAVLDAYIDYYIDNGFPIFGVSPFMDGRQPKLRRRGRPK
jgi:hypothetical protein